MWTFKIFSTGRLEVCTICTFLVHTLLLGVQVTCCAHHRAGTSLFPTEVLLWGFLVSFPLSLYRPGNNSTLTRMKASSPNKSQPHDENMLPLKLGGQLGFVLRDLVSGSYPVTWTRLYWLGTVGGGMKGNLEWFGGYLSTWPSSQRTFFYIIKAHWFSCISRCNTPHLRSSGIVVWLSHSAKFKQLFQPISVSWSCFCKIYERSRPYLVSSLTFSEKMN